MHGQVTRIISYTRFDNLRWARTCFSLGATTRKKTRESLDGSRLDLVFISFKNHSLKYRRQTPAMFDSTQYENEKSALPCTHTAQHIL